MVYHVQAITANGIAAVLLMSLMVNFRRRYSNGSPEMKTFFAMLVINLLQCILEPATILLDGVLFPGAVPVLTVVNTALYINNILFALLWAMYARLRVRIPIKGKADLLRLVPAGLVVLGAVANLFTPVFFRVSAENVYSRTGLFLLPFVVTYYYLIMGLVAIYRYGGRLNEYIIMPAVTFLTPVFLASALQLLLPGISLLWVGAAIGLVSAYVCLLDEGSSIDALSGAYSRPRMNAYLSNLPKLQDENRQVIGIMMDIDRFKTINDRFGHLVGDNAIRDVGKLLRRAVGQEGMVFRYAGDEFVVILVVRSEQALRRFLGILTGEIQKFNREQERPYEIALSLGYTTYVPGENPLDFLKRMDDAMYRQKNAKTAEADQEAENE